MPVMISAADAKLQGQGNLVLIKEVRAIEEAILTAVDSSLMYATVADGTVMTMSTPIIEITGSLNNPTLTAGDDFLINSSTVTLTGTTLNSVVDDINTLAIAGITASKTAVTGALKINSDNNKISLDSIFLSNEVNIPVTLDISENSRSLIVLDDYNHTYIDASQ